MASTLQKYQDRKSRAEKFLLAGFILVALAFVALILIIFNVLPEDSMWLFPSLLVIGGIVILIGTVLFNRVQKAFKHGFLRDYLSDKIEDGEFIPKKGFKRKQGLQPDEVYACEFLPKADRFYSFDRLRGTIDGVRFDSSDIKLQHIEYRTVRRGGKTRRKREVITYFYGRMFEFDFNKNFEGSLQVLEPKMPPRTKGAMFGKNFGWGPKAKPQSSRGFDSVELESVEFNETFNTFATKEHTAFYVLTPHFMESLMKLEKQHPGKVYFSFIDNRLHMAIHNGRPTFSLKPFRKLDESYLETFKQDIDIIYDVVDELKLNRNIFKEE